MPRMVRKQVYIYKQQEAQLKKISEARGVSEAEIVRQAVEREVTQALGSHHDENAWAKILAFVDGKSKQAAPGKPYQFRRQDAYKERETRLLNGRE